MSLKCGDIMKIKREVLLAQAFHINRQLNELTHPGRLPPELLSEIFMNIYPYDPKEQTSDGVLAAAQVCHHWREVALQNPLLWTHIETNRSTEYITMMLERSRNCLLDVSDADDSWDSFRDDSDIFPLLWPQIHRVRSVFLSQSPPRKHLPSSKLSAPHLETYIEEYLPSGYGYDDSPFLPLIDTPLLRHAKLMTPSIHALCPLTKLTHLELFWSDDDDETDVVPFEDVMTILGNLPCLSTLHIGLQFSLWQEDPLVPLECPTVLFQHLQHLKFIAPGDVVGAGLFLEHAKFSIPPSIVVTTDIHCICPIHLRVQQLAAEGVRSILKRWNPPNANPGLHLRLTDRPRAGGVPDDMTLSLSVPATLAQSIKSPQDEEYLLLLKFPCPRETDIYRLLPPLCPNLRLLTIGAHQCSSRMQAFREMLGQLKAVEAVTVTNCRNTCYSYCQRVRRTDTHQLQFIDLNKVLMAANNTPLLPRLVTVKFTCSDITGNLGCTSCPPRLDDDEEWQVCNECGYKLHYPRLVEWLKKRHELGVPLARLAFENCSELDELRRMELRFLVTDEMTEMSGANGIKRYLKLVVA